MSFEAESPVVEDWTIVDEILGLDARGGTVAWVERSDNELRLVRYDGQEEQAATLQLEDVGWMPIRIIEDATVVVSATHVAPIVSIASRAGVATPLHGCFASAVHPGVVQGLGADGSHVLVLGEDEDPDDTEGDLWRCALDGSSVLELADDGLWPGLEGSGGALEVDGRIYWPSSDEVFRVEEGGLVPVSGPWFGTGHIAFDGEVAYVAKTGTIRRYRGPVEEILFTGVMTSKLAVTRGFIVFADWDRTETLVVVPLP